MRRLIGLCLALSVAAAIFGELRYALVAAAISVTAAWILDPVAVRTGLRTGVVLGIAFAGAITAAVVAWAEGPQRGIEIGGMVLVRLVVLTAAAAVLVRSVDAEALLLLSRRMGLERLGLVLGLALNSLPRIADAASEVWMAAAVRSRGTRDRLRRLPAVGEVLLAHTARIADEAAAAASLRGHSALTRPGVTLASPVRVVVVTGPPDGGKTRTVVDIAGRLRGEGVPVVGFVQPGVHVEGHKIGFRLRDLATGEETTLAALVPRSDGEFGTRFSFSEDGFRLGREALAETRAGVVLIIDELGPVELRGAGNMPAVRRALAVAGLAGVVVVVRRALVPSLLAALDATDAVVVDLESVGDRGVEAILEALGTRLRPG